MAMLLLCLSVLSLSLFLSISSSATASHQITTMDGVYFPQPHKPYGEQMRTQNEWLRTHHNDNNNNNPLAGGASVVDLRESHFGYAENFQRLDKQRKFLNFSSNDKTSGWLLLMDSPLGDLSPSD